MSGADREANVFRVARSRSFSATYVKIERHRWVDNEAHLFVRLRQWRDIVQSQRLSRSTYRAAKLAAVCS